MDQTISLNDGRTLGYAEYGDPDGRPLLFFHDQTGNRLFHHPDDALTASHGVRLIVPDRPGYGLSTFQPGRRIIDWPQDVLTLARELALETFAVAGFGGGGPYALACAYNIDVRRRHLTRAGVINCAPPLHYEEMRETMPGDLRRHYLFVRWGRPLYRLWSRIAWLWRTSEDFIDRERLAEADRAALEQSATREMLLACWQENLRASRRGYTQETELLMHHWGFKLFDITAPVHLWHGEADRINLPGWGRFVAAELRHGELTTWPEAGHFGLFEHWGDILSTLVED